MCVGCAARLQFVSVDGGLGIELMTDEAYNAMNEFDRNALDAFIEQIKKLPPSNNADVGQIRDRVANAMLPFSDDEIDTIAHVAYESERAYAHLLKVTDISAWPSFRELPPSQIAEHRELIRSLLASGSLPTSNPMQPADCRMIFEITGTGFAQLLRDVQRHRPRLLFQAGCEVVIRKLVTRHHVKTIGMPYVGVVSPGMAKAMEGAGGTTIVDDLEIRDEVMNLFKTHELPVYDGPDGVLIVQDSATTKPVASA